MKKETTSVVIRLDGEGKVPIPGLPDFFKMIRLDTGNGICPFLVDLRFKLVTLYA